MKRKIILLILVLCAAMLLGTVCVGAASGSCGTDVTWAFDESTGTLTISGSGAMRDFYSTSYTPWYADSTKITAVVIEEGVTGIGNNAFSNFSKLTSVQIASTVKSIGKSAFFMCTSLTEVRIPAATESIGSSTFFGCSKLTGISVAPGNPNYCSDASGVLYNKAKTVLIQAPGRLSGSYTVPRGVTQITGQAFFDCAGLTGITLPEGLTQIGSAAFRNCTKLKAVSLPQTITTIGNGAFLGCPALSEITVDEKNSAYSSDASGVLFNKEKTLLIQSPGGLSGSYELPGSVREIAANAFWSCESLIQVRLPVGLKTIGKAAFASCFSLESINIPATVTEIPEEAFNGCFALTKITIPSSVVRIGAGAFHTCESMKEITFAGNAPEIAENAFADVYADAYYPGSNATWTEAVRQSYGGGLKWQSMPLFNLTTVAMNLGNSLTMIFYVPAENVTVGDYALITKSYADGRDDVAVKVPIASCSIVSYNGAEYYLAGFDGIAAKEMTDNVTCVIYNSNNTAISNPLTATVKDYVQASFALGDAKLNRVMADLLNYGAAAQKAFGYNDNDENLANADMTEEQQGYATKDIDVDALAHYKNISGVAPLEIALLLKNNTRMMLFYPAAGLNPNMVAKISYTDHHGNEKVSQVKVSDFGTEKAGQLCLIIDTLLAADYKTTLTVEIYDGTELVSSNEVNLVKYCALNPGYVASIPLAKYCQAAYAFFH